MFGKSGTYWAGEHKRGQFRGISLTAVLIARLDDECACGKDLRTAHIDKVLVEGVLRATPQDRVQDRSSGSLSP